MSKHKDHGSAEQILYKSETPLKTGKSLLLDCPKCHSFISSEQINLANQSAKCGHCNNEFSFAEEWNKDPHRRPEIMIPDGVEALKLSSMLEIVIDWYQSSPKKSIGTMALSAFFWNLFLIPLVILLFFSKNFIFILFFGGHVFTGLALLAYLVAMFVNKTHLEVNREGIKIRHAPFKSILNKPRFIPKDQIKQLYVTRYTERYTKRNKKGIPAYALYVILQNDKRIELIKGMDRNTQLYLEQEIETYLGIPDERIKGEVSRLS
ncbi:MAG: hypothetical protein OEQ53_22760 [Saprospiraceae bacterium]|nr:hypothetical protein [Saprospiraceae bacterium]